jgi:hypothetical protein
MKNDPLHSKYKNVLTEAYISSGGEASVADVSEEGNINQGTPEVALTAQIAGLYDPEDEAASKQTQVAINELTQFLQEFETGLETWQRKYKGLGALDTVARESIAQYIAKSVLGLTRLD